MGYPMVENLAGHLIATPAGLLDAASPESAGYFTPCDKPMFYEVVRLVEGQPLFWDDHCQRLRSSVGDQFALDTDHLLRDSRRLIDALGDQARQANLRLVLTADDHVIHLSPTYYPTPEQFAAGVPVTLLHQERKTPNIKTIDPDYKAAVAAGFAAGGPYGAPFELLLVNRQGQITEGSRSNVFFVRGNTVISAPDELILLGITRRHVISAIRTAGARLEIGLLPVEAIESGAVDAAFLTGSPIDILPISAIGATRLPSAGNPLITAIHEAYQAIVRADLDSRKKQTASSQVKEEDHS